MEDGDFYGRKELWNIHVRCFRLGSHSLVQGEENFLLVPSCPKVSPSPQILLELDIFNIGRGARFLSLSSLRGRTYRYNQLGGEQ